MATNSVTTIINFVFINIINIIIICPRPQNTSSPGGDEVVQQSNKGDNEPNAVDTQRSSDLNLDTHKSSESNQDTHKLSDSNVETRQQFSPGMVTRSRTFRKSAGTPDVTGAKPQGSVSQFGSVEREAWGPSSSLAGHRSMSPHSHQQVVRQENKHRENKNSGPTKISWSETGDNLAMSPRQLQPAANKQVSGQITMDQLQYNILQ